MREIMNKMRLDLLISFVSVNTARTRPCRDNVIWRLDV